MERKSKKKVRLEKADKKRRTVKPTQVNLCRFITIRYEVFEKINDRYKRTGSQHVNGLQIENKIYLGKGRYKYLNSHSVKIKKVYQGIPHWASEELVNLYIKTIKNNRSEKNE